MWDYVIIGTGNRGNSASIVLDINERGHISHNAVSYWISNVYLGLGMTIFKDTKQGQALTKMIQDKTPLEEINEFLQGILLKNISADKLKSAIDRALENSFRAGAEHKAQEFREVLGFN